MAGEFDAIDKPEQTVEVGGRTFTVRPLTIGQLPAFTRALKPVMPALGPLLGGAEGRNPVELLPALTELIAEHGDALIEAVALALRVPRKDVEELDPMAFLALILPVIKVNADFFARRLQPVLIQALGAGAGASGGGQTPSKP